MGGNGEGDGCAFAQHRVDAQLAAMVMGLAFGAILAAALAGHFVQHGLIFTTSKMEPKLSKLNPVEGVTRILGPQGWVNFLKGLAKMTLVAIAITIVLWPRMRWLV